LDDSASSIANLRDRIVTPGLSFLAMCDGKFLDQDLTAEGNALVGAYFANSGTGQPITPA
jgi:hypothetical protein